MLNYIWLALIAIGIVVGGLLGRFGGEDSGVVGSMFEYAKLAVEIAIGLGGLMMMWLGVLRLAERAGMIQMLARALRPIMTRLFPEVPADHPAMGSMIMNMAANMLGLGNAATPLGLKAMEQLEKLNPHKGVATNSMCTFLAINTSSVTLIPVTAIAILSSAGVSNPYQVIAPAILATLCSTCVAILAVKTFQGMPMFRISKSDIQDAAEEGDGEEKPGEESKSLVPLRAGHKILLGVIALLFVGFLALETMPEADQRAFRESIGIAQLADELNGVTAPQDDSAEEAEATDATAAATPAEETAEETEEAAPAQEPFFLRGMFGLSAVAVPFIFLFFTLYAALRGVRVYEEFVEGAKEGWNVVVRIMPYLVAMLVALGIFRSSGALSIFQMLLRPILQPLGFPTEVLPMALMRPLSGSGSSGVLTDIVTTPGVSDTVQFTAATMFGSTETTFYVLAVYFGSVAIRKTRHALAAGLCADLAGLIAAVAICKMMFG